MDKVDLLEVKLEALTRELERFRKTMLVIYATIIAPIIIVLVSAAINYLLTTGRGK